jgi:hypothetical protein
MLWTTTASRPEPRAAAPLVRGSSSSNGASPGRSLLGARCSGVGRSTSRPIAGGTGALASDMRAGVHRPDWAV